MSGCRLSSPRSASENPRRPNLLGCQFGKGAPAWHVIMIELEGKLRTEYKSGAITVEGTLHVKPYNGPDGKTWAVYFLEGTKVE